MTMDTRFRRLQTLLLATSTALALVASPALAQRGRGGTGMRGEGMRNGNGGPAALTDSAVVAGIPVRSIGPAVMSGRIVSIAVASSANARGGSLGTVVYVGAATGGVWKSTDAGASWTSVFDHYGVSSIGAVAVAPSNSDIVWVGTGEANNMRSSSYGDGVYKSTDGGKTFKFMGLRTSQQIGHIAVDPRDPDIVYIAAVGPLWAGGGERGVYRTTDGGKTWKAVLTGNRWTGATYVVLDPTDPSIVYAAMLQRERRAYSFVGGGPGSGIWKSTDGGDTWTRLTDGLPTSDMGRIGLDVCRSQPNTVYAVIEGSEHGVYRSDDGGSSWHKQSDIESIPWYFGQIRVDPNNPDVVYHLGVSLSVSTDGGVTWNRVGPGLHADNHAMWINPDDSDNLMVGNDGGFYVSYDRGATWDFSVNLPVSQFYTVGFDNAEPFYNVYGGLQDNSVWGGPSRNRQRSGIVNADWFEMTGGDGFYAVTDPTDPTISYVESQNGGIVRYDRRTGEQKSIRPQPAVGQPEYRFNWSAPILISPHDHNTIYFAANYVFKSTDRGDHWQRLGEDLTRHINPDSLKLMGVIQKPDAVALGEGTAAFGNISTLDESPIKAGVLITGTDDGVVSISQDDGKTWNKIMHFPGVPDTAYVSKVRASYQSLGTFYVTFDNHRSNDFKPYVLKTTDWGKSWTSIAGNLPAFGSVRGFVQHPKDPDLLFAGTETGPFVTVDGGQHWTRFTDGMPTVPVTDLKVQPRDNALLIATHGRGIYIVDDLRPLEYLAEARKAGGPYLVPVESQLLFVPDGSKTSGTHASRNYSAPNPRVGVTVSYWLPLDLRGGVSLEILDPSGREVRKLEASRGPGMHRVFWDFRYNAPYTGPPEQNGQAQQGRGGFGGGFGRFGRGNQGPMVAPGPYVARLTVTPRGGGAPTVLEQRFTAIRDPEVRLTDAQIDSLTAMRRSLAAMQGRLAVALKQADEVQQQLTGARAAMARVTVPAAVTSEANAIGREVGAVIQVLRGRSGRGFGFGGGEGGGGVVQTPTVTQLVAQASGINRATAMPTEYEQQALAEIPGMLDAQIAKLNAALARVPAFFKSLDDAGVPWSPGRPVRGGGR